jgi:hypothetical protein
MHIGTSFSIGEESLELQITCRMTFQGDSKLQKGGSIAKCLKLRIRNQQHCVKFAVRVVKAYLMNRKKKDSIGIG